MNLDELRVKINDINEQMLSLFKERMALSKDVSKAKKEMNKAVYDPKRERDILDKVTLEAGPDMDLYARRFFESLFQFASPEIKLTSACETEVNNHDRLSDSTSWAESVAQDITVATRAHNCFIE